MVRTRLYRDGVLAAEGFPIAEVSDHLHDPSATVWFDLCAPPPEKLALISEELGLHPLAVEDVLHPHQRPKLDVYESHLFLTVYNVVLDNGGLKLCEISVFVTRNALVTVRSDDTCDIDAITARWDGSPGMAKHGVSFLLHSLLDYVVDGHFEVAQTLDDRVEGLEDDLFGEQPTDGRALQRQMFDLRRTAVRFRRVVVPMREVVSSLMRRDLQIVRSDMTPYYQDVYDHVLRVSEWTDSLRDLIGNVYETHLNLQGYRMNDIMKRVTSWAAIIAVPTAITGFYGQNIPYPGFAQASGFWVSTLTIVAASLVLYVVFRKNDWI
ncbi:magnesium transporter CorA family protein [Sphaerisporangium sp. TRM90804]|uniref:magnesium transporter CorA family protein n=1 Tax=Sphaerisporangium sp. TRM90804 TaxID=3031113 RepID=UPI00244BA6B2|nr:magnesium transporter CorA family protein [Sphaerisporangium sp. TRM90804]MDH2424036.1 magnesium transporter CorA family protein [Sphaerisporangium sp. TRM90804]